MPKQIFAAFCSLIFALMISNFLMADQPNINQIEHPFVKAKVKKESIKHNTCPTKIALDANIVYPQDTGNVNVDQFFENYSDDFLKNAKTSNKNVLANSDVCTLGSNLYSNADFESYKPNSNILGILFMIESYLGGANGKFEYQSYNFDLTSGKELDITDLFPSPKDSLPKLYSFLYSELCTDSPPKHPAAATVLGGKCGKDKTAPNKLLNLKGPLDNLAHLALNAKGANLNFLATDLWSVMSQGPYTLLIPKDKLIEMGTNDLWGDAPSR